MNRFLLVVGAIMISSAARSQPLLPVALPIQNIAQETPVWCWAAVAQQIIYSLRGNNGTPPQCGLVAISSGLSPNYCCQSPTPCMRTGHLVEIQRLIQYFGGRYSSIAPPTDPYTVYRTLSSGKPIIMAVQSSPFAGHVVVIIGMEWRGTMMVMEPILYVNDPMGFFTQPVPFAHLLPYWRAAIVIN